MADIMLSWRFDVDSTIRWLVEQASLWRSDQAGNAIFADLRHRGALLPEVKDSLAAFAAWRRQDAADNEPDHNPKAPIGAEMLSEAATHQRRTLAALIEGTCDAPACFQTGQDRLRTALDKDIRSASLADVAAELAALAEEAGVRDWLQRVSRLIWADKLGIDNVTLEIRLIWSPVPASATIFGSFILLPVSSQEMERTTWKQAILGVVVHEFGHWCVSRLPRRDRVCLTNTILAAGLPNRYHFNLVEEAIHTAIGNILFVRDKFGESALRPVVYGYESQSDYPYAIDSLSREVAPEIDRLLDPESGSTFGDAVATVLRHQRDVLPPKPIHFTRIGLLVTNNASAQRLFKGLFPAMRRWEIGEGDLNLLMSFPDAPHLPRWFLWVGALTDLPANIPQDMAAAAQSACHAGFNAWCATRMAKTQAHAFDAVVWAASVPDMREVLIKLHQATGLPTVSNPLTLHYQLAAKA
ncbi:MAG: hypothetical protein QNJ09_08285 [Paracoccaceae bacterium]|nr:hypothetical protein [Paracoccaceae bacterium]